MRKIVNQKVGCLFMLLLVLFASATMIYRFVRDPTLIAQQTTDLAAPTATLPPLASPKAGLTATSAPTPCHAQTRDFEMGIAFPQWTPAGYGGGDSEWLTELPTMHTQTAACWVEMPLLLNQSSLTDATIAQGPSTPTLAAFTYGIQLAHAEGLHVFVTLLLQVDGSQPWAGAITFSTYAQEQQWFLHYWQAIQPYVQAAQLAGAEQLAIGTEEEWLQANAPDSLWNGFISKIHSIFSGTLTYDMNWTSLPKSPPNWMRNPDLQMIGISAYLPQVSTPARFSEQQISNLWTKSALPELDTFAEKLGKPIFISELGYRDSADALYQPWVSTSSAPADPQEQADAYAAALENIATDTHILGSFFWGWDEAGAFDLKGSLAVQTIHSYYTSWRFSTLKRVAKA